MNITYRQVLKRFNDENVNEKEMLLKFNVRDLRLVTTGDRNSNDFIH